MRDCYQSRSENTRHASLGHGLGFEKWSASRGSDKARRLDLARTPFRRMSSERVDANRGWSMSLLRQRRLRAAAWITLAIHAVAGAAMLAVLKNGLGTNPDVNDRMRFLVEEITAWRGAWLTWNFAAASILYFFTRMAQAHASDGPRTARWCRIALTIGAIAVLFDLSAEWLMMFALPRFARASAVDSFLLTDRIAVLLTGGIANGLYTLATLILALATRSSYPTWTWLAGVGVGIVGSLLSISAYLNSITGLFLTNAILVPLLNLWLLGVALSAARTEKK
jgi:hypothetical protein